ncbi:MAG: chitinase [Lachnospiraceae bacterium]|nr:chitinase [Lachnospiraceae bacterium]
MKKKIIPVAIAIALILVIGGLSFGRQIIDRYSYSKERYDLKTYFENDSDTDVAIIRDGQFMEDRAFYLKDTCYVTLDFVLTYLNSRFYYDEVEDLLIYTLPEHMLVVSEGQKTVTDRTEDTAQNYDYAPFLKEKGEILVALDYAALFSVFEYEYYDEPKRIRLTSSYDQRTVASAKKDTAVRHRGGVKSEILTDLKEGDKVIVLEQMDEWSKVMTKDALIGYVENRHLDGVMPELPIPSSTDKYPGYDAEYTSLTENRKIIMGFHAVAGEGGNSTLSEMTANVKGMNVISPTWFKINDNEGNFVSYATQDYVNRAHDMGLEVWALAENIEFSGEIDMDAILSATTTRQKLVHSLVEKSLELGIDGINIDFELLPASAGKDFSEFIREISIECRRNGLVLSVDNYVPIGGTGYYDRKTQGEAADYVVIMGYDEHYAGSSEAGSVASIGYVETGITMTLDEVPAAKIINAVPFYTRIWETEGSDVTSQAVDMQTASDWLSNHSLTPEWDEETCQNYASYKDGNKTVECWLEDEESLKVRLNIMNKYELGGFACWRLGFEKPGIWDVIEEDYAGN